MRCPNCGVQTPGAARFCPRCAEPLHGLTEAASATEAHVTQTASMSAGQAASQAAVGTVAQVTRDGRPVSWGWAAVVAVALIAAALGGVMWQRAQASKEENLQMAKDYVVAYFLGDAQQTLPYAPKNLSLKFDSSWTPLEMRLHYPGVEIPGGPYQLESATRTAEGYVLRLSLGGQRTVELTLSPDANRGSGWFSVQGQEVLHGRLKQCANLMTGRSPRSTLASSARPSESGAILT